MKKLNLFVGAVALVVIVAVNVCNATDVFSSSELFLANVEALAAGGEGYGSQEAVPHWFEVDSKVKSRHNKTKTITEFYCEEAENVTNDNCVPGTTKRDKHVETIIEPYTPGPWPNF